jgi:hypothetical protein
MMRYRYEPGLLDTYRPIVIRGRPIAAGAMVRIERDHVDPLGRLVWVADEMGNIQSVFRRALRPTGTRCTAGRSGRGR